MAADPYRPAAVDQLETLGKRLDIPVYRAPVGHAGRRHRPRRHRRGQAPGPRRGHPRHRRPSDDRRGADGRDRAPSTRAVQPTETLLVVDAMIGQEAVAVAEAFPRAVPVTRPGPDQDRRRRPRRRRAVDQRRHRRAGQVPGHRREDRRPRGLPSRPAGRPDPRHGRRADARRAGPGDVDQKQAEQLDEKLRKNAFTLDDMLEQMQQLQKMGPLGQLMSMIPGMGGLAKRGAGGGRPRRAQADRGDHPVDDAATSGATRPSSTPRAAGGSPRGSGTTLPDVNRLVKQFGEMQKLMKQLSRRRQAGSPRRVDGPALSRQRRTTMTDDPNPTHTRHRPAGSAAARPTARRRPPSRRRRPDAADRRARPRPAPRRPGRARPQPPADAAQHCRVRWAIASPSSRSIVAASAAVAAVITGRSPTRSSSATCPDHDRLVRRGPPRPAGRPARRRRRVPLASSRASPTRPRSTASSTRSSTSWSRTPRTASRPTRPTSSRGSTASSRSASGRCRPPRPPRARRRGDRLVPGLALLSIKDPAPPRPGSTRRSPRPARRRRQQTYNGATLTLFEPAGRRQPRVRHRRRQGRRRG